MNCERPSASITWDIADSILQLLLCYNELEVSENLTFCNNLNAPL
jgi:hypothetical protein